MKMGLLSLTMAIICIATAHSSPVPNWLDQIQDLNTERLLELQEQDGGSGSPARLQCFICEEDCSTEEELEPCESGFDCSTVTALRNDIEALTEIKVKVCLPTVLCSSGFVCSNLNETGDLESCNVDCCGTDGCNAEPTTPPTEPTTPPTEPTTPPTEPTTPPTEPPTPPTQPPPPPTTTPAPRIVTLGGNNRVFRSPGFFDGSYPPNLDITWLIPGNVRGLTLDFLTIDTEAGRDIITIRRGNTVVRTLSGVFQPSRGKRSLSIPLYQEDGRCDRDDDEIADDFFRYDIPYARLAAAYERYRRQRRPRAPCVYVRGPSISINFSSDGNDTGQRGFSARFRVRYRGDGDGDDK